MIEGYDPPEGWGWCYIDEVMLDLGHRVTPHNGPIRRYDWPCSVKKRTSGGA